MHYLPASLSYAVDIQKTKQHEQDFVTAGAFKFKPIYYDYTQYTGTITGNLTCNHMSGFLQTTNPSENKQC